MSEINSRELVLDMLLMVEREEAFSHRIIKEVLTKYDYLTGQEKAFIKRLFEGTLERQIQIDYFLNQISSVPVKKMKPLIRNLLRMSAYQILFMDGVPDAAAANEAVKLAAKRKFYNLKGFVNGVLRKLSTQKESLPMPSKKEEPDRFLSVKYSMPDWIVEHFLAHFSYEKTERILEGLLAVRPVTIRFKGTLTEEKKKRLLSEFSKRGVTVKEHPFVKQAYELTGCENLAALPGFSEGAFAVQDASSMLAVAAAGIKKGDSVLDICAAPGGKTMLAAEYVADGVVEARDVSEYKVSLIEENLQRMQLSNVHTRVFDATKPDEKIKESMDVVLADVPCTGLGVMGKKRDIKYRQKKEALTEIVELQKEIAVQAASYLKPGGTLLYSTCTINPSENEEMVFWIQKELDLVPESVAEVLSGMPACETAEKGFIQLLPGIHGTDGFFFAKLKKPEDGNIKWKKK